MTKSKDKQIEELEREIKEKNLIFFLLMALLLLFMVLWGLEIDRFQVEKQQLSERQEKVPVWIPVWTLKVECDIRGEYTYFEQEFDSYESYEYVKNNILSGKDPFFNPKECEVLE